MTVRRGTQPGDRLRMRGYGVPHVHSPGRKGDQYVLLNVRLPREVGPLFYSAAAHWGPANVELVAVPRALGFRIQGLGCGYGVLHMHSPERKGDQDVLLNMRACEVNICTAPFTGALLTSPCDADNTPLHGWVVDGFQMP